MLGHESRTRAIEIRIVGRTGRQTVDVAIEHAERGGDQDGVVDLEVPSAAGPRAADVLGGYALATFRGLGGDAGGSTGFQETPLSVSIIRFDYRCELRDSFYPVRRRDAW